jgi:hypothetical protein
MRGDVTWRARRASLILCALLLAGGCDYLHRYKLPSGDGGGDYAPHALQGRITALDADRLTVASDGGDTTVIPIAPGTRFYKLTGGVVLRPELMVGHRVRVWFASPKVPTGPAAVVLLASLDPSDDWPK